MYGLILSFISYPIIVHYCKKLLDNWGFDYDMGMKLAVFVVATILSTIIGYVTTDVHHFFEPTKTKIHQKNNHQSSNSVTMLNCLNNIANPKCIQLLNH